MKDNDLERVLNYTPVGKGKTLQELLGAAPMMAENKGMEEIELDLIDDLYSFDHPFAKSLKNEIGIEELAQQINVDGVLQPIIVRMNTNGRYELLAGHRRKRACLMLGRKTIPAIRRDVTDDVAKLIVTHTNLGQRDEILPSEKAKAYKMELEAIKRVAGRPVKNSESPDNIFEEDEDEKNSGPLVQNFSKGIFSVDVVAEKIGENRKQIQRFIRLNELVDPLLDRVDEKLIPLRAAVELSYLRPQEQKVLDLILSQNPGLRVSIDLARELRESSKEMELTYPIMDAVINPVPEKRKEIDPESKPPKPAYKEVFRGLEKRFKKLSCDKAEKLALVSREELEAVIIEAIEQYTGKL